MAKCPKLALCRGRQNSSLTDLVMYLASAPPKYPPDALLAALRVVVERHHQLEQQQAQGERLGRVPWTGLVSELIAVLQVRGRLGGPPSRSAVRAVLPPLHRAS